MSSRHDRDREPDYKLIQHPYNLATFLGMLFFMATTILMTNLMFQEQRRMEEYRELFENSQRALKAGKR